jgi:3-oxoacyl-[acyl-carrier-protein] synthase-3
MRIKERPIIKAAQDLLAKSNVDPLEIDMIIMATATPDMPVAFRVFVATAIGATNALLMIYKLRV